MGCLSPKMYEMQGVKMKKNEEKEKPEFLQNENFTIDRTSTLFIEITKKQGKLKATVWDDYDEENLREMMVLDGGDFCKINPYCFSAIVVSPDSIKLKPDVSFFARKKKETIFDKEFTTIVLSRVDKTHCGG